MNKITVIIPTIWSTDIILKSIENLEKSNIIDEIIIINNRPKLTKHIHSNKVKIFNFEKNLYVNESWNIGISKSSNEYICLLNDDIIIDDNFTFDYASKCLDSKQVGLIGIDKCCFKHNDIFLIEKISIRNRGYGTMIFLKKSEFIPIPNDLKIWFGDDWLIKIFENRVYKLRGPYIWTHMSSSSNLPEFINIINDDIENSKKYNLPWSNDFED